VRQLPGARTSISARPGSRLEEAGTVNTAGETPARALVCLPRAQSLARPLAAEAPASQVNRSRGKQRSARMKPAEKLVAASAGVSMVA